MPAPRRPGNCSIPAYRPARRGPGGNTDSGPGMSPAGDFASYPPRRGPWPTRAGPSTTCFCAQTKCPLGHMSRQALVSVEPPSRTAGQGGSKHGFHVRDGPILRPNSLFSSTFSSVLCFGHGSGARRLFGPGCKGAEVNNSTTYADVAPAHGLVPRNNMNVHIDSDATLGSLLPTSQEL